jgi:hypothetical protein
VTRFIKLCDVEQRLNTENINLLTQSSKELISLPYCTIFDQMFCFLPEFPSAISRKSLTAALKFLISRKIGVK